MLARPVIAVEPTAHKCCFARYRGALTCRQDELLAAQVSAEQERAVAHIPAVLVVDELDQPDWAVAQVARIAPPVLARRNVEQRLGVERAH